MNIEILYPYLKLLYFFLKNFRQIFFLIEIEFFIAWPLSFFDLSKIVKDKDS